MSYEELLILYHQRMWHTSYGILNWVYPHLFEKADKTKLFCNACEFGKLTKSSYVSSDHRSFHAFDVIHSDVWGPCSASSTNGYRYFVSFIDCFSHVTWLYLIRKKNEVFSCFKAFHRAFQSQYGAVVKVLRYDNGTEYANITFRAYLLDQGIQHQIKCQYTPKQKLSSRDEE